ncbi:MAG TPA: CBS domain-containing protein [Polyangiales bacterium]
MNKPIPSVQAHMTASPHSIGRDQPLIRAHEFMREHKIRHLPVLDRGELVGILSDRDLALIEAMQDVNPTLVNVDDAMSTEVYAVAPDTPLDQVARSMAEHKYGCAVVLHKQQVVGIYTTVDVCRSLAEVLHPR